MFKHIIADGKEWTVFEPDKATILKSQKIDFVRKDAKYIEDILSISDTFDNAIDCGACYGFWTYLLQPYFKNIYAFELVNAHRICFLKNMENFHISVINYFPLDWVIKQLIVQLVIMYGQLKNLDMQHSMLMSLKIKMVMKKLGL